MKEVRGTQEVFRWGGVVALLYAAVMTVQCPCDVLLKCEDHYTKVTGAVGLFLILITLDNLTGPAQE